MAQKFKFGFCWLKYNGYSYMASIENRNEDGTYDVSTGLVGGRTITFTQVPESVLQPIRGDEV